MTRDTVGRFCQSCQKSVIDFSSKSDEEIKEFLKDKQGQKLCGRFYKHQVERIRIEIDRNVLVSPIPFWQKFLAIVLVVFGSELFGYDFVFAQTETDTIPVKVEQQDSTITELPELQDSVPDLSTEKIQIEIRKPKFEIYTAIDFPVIVSRGFYVEEAPGLCPSDEIDLVPNRPLTNEAFYVKEDNSNSEVPKTGIILAAETEPKRPKAPKKAPRPQENAVIADSGERRKTRRS